MPEREVTAAEILMGLRAAEAIERASRPPQPTVRVTRYEVSCLPEDDTDRAAFDLSVEYRGNGRWGVFRNPHCCLGSDGEWSWGYAWQGGKREPASDDEWSDYHAGRDRWLDEHRFDEQTAIKLAEEAAPHVKVNGYTVEDAIRMHAKRKEQRRGE